MKSEYAIILVRAAYPTHSKPFKALGIAQVKRLIPAV
jgi:hypothetical protein